MENLTEQQAIEERAKYVAAFNDTMVKIWQEQITLLDVIDTGRLLQSPIGVKTTADGKISEVHLSQAFLEYGLWQDYAHFGMLTVGVHAEGRHEGVFGMVKDVEEPLVERQSGTEHRGQQQVVLNEGNLADAQWRGHLLGLIG